MLAASRSSSPRSPPPVPRLRPASVSGPRLLRHRLSFGPPRSLGALGCAQSFLPLYSVVAAPCLTSHLSGKMEKMVDGRDRVGVVQWEALFKLMYLKK
ncbi:hypothetical protein OPV22_024441 [Ensete ventricosum]|uniref:Uncharacterized protein n=1 Tax=Ensete ventricosum TaxID=4639 RepID=A0AAV8Q9R8_ENSVE|nr:hypothetical protein OPV22_024441 [Ensete ventricosum]